MAQYSVGQKVKFSGFYNSNYSGIKKYIDQEASIVLIKEKVFKDSQLSKESKPLFRTIYGVQQEYSLFELMIKFEDETFTYMVSQFGIKVVE
jgi:hypothetical protein